MLKILSMLTTLFCASQVDEPAYTRRKVGEFLRSHTCYELIPESGKVVLLDLDLPVRQVGSLWGPSVLGERSGEQRLACQLITPTDGSGS